MTLGADATLEESPLSKEEWLVNRARKLVWDYSLDIKDPDADWMIQTLRCMICHSQIAEDIGKNGTALICLGEAWGVNCSKVWWLDRRDR